MTVHVVGTSRKFWKEAQVKHGRGWVELIRFLSRVVRVKSFPFSRGSYVLSTNFCRVYLLKLITIVNYLLNNSHNIISVRLA